MMARYSCDPADRGFEAFTALQRRRAILHVSIDGVRQKNAVITADSDTGEVVRFVLRDGARIKDPADRRRPLREQFVAAVTFEIEERADVIQAKRRAEFDRRAAARDPLLAALYAAGDAARMAAAVEKRKRKARRLAEQSGAVSDA